LKTSINYGSEAGMGEMRKITVEVPNDLLERVQEFTGVGVSETVRAALKRMDSIRAQQEMLKLRGKVKFSMTWEEMKHDRE
jgi:Arc/MetJ-type ribon-helix-helix transcriptional regulator